MIRKILSMLKNVAKGTVYALALAILIFNLAFMSDLATSILDLDGKVDVMIEQSKQIEAAVNGVVTPTDIAKLMRANVVIVNRTRGISGSGTVIKIVDKYFILSVAHLDDAGDTFDVIENGDALTIKLVKVNHSVDLALFEFVDVPQTIEYINLAKKEPRVGDKIIVVGNPAMIEDCVTRGEIVQKRDIYYLINALIYHGNSGGGLFNQKGELMGVNIAVVSPDATGRFSLGLTVNLKTIKKFLIGKIESEI